MSIGHLFGYVGTYTKGDSKGIYRFILNYAEGKITEIKAASVLENPTYLTISKDNRFLYAVVKEGDNGGIAAFSLDGSTGGLLPINSEVSPGPPPCHVSVNSDNRFVFAANYHKGTIQSHTIALQSGAVMPPAAIIKHEGSGPDARQEKAHTHFAGVTPDEKYVAAVELGSDAIITYLLHEDGTMREAIRLAVHPGSGPRHLVFHPNKRYAYVMTEFSSEIILLTYHPEDGHFSENCYYSTLPQHFKKNNQGSAIHISADGRFVYAGNRGHNSIAVFGVNQQSGELSFVEHTFTEGEWPRDFSLDPTEQFVVAVNQESSNLVLFSRDKESGKLTLLPSDITVPDPVCVKFIN